MSGNATYDDKARIQEMLDDSVVMLEQWRAGRIPSAWHDLLVAVSATVAGDQGRIRVLDFGGGLGTGYIQLAATLSAGVEIQYDIVDLEQMRTAGSALFAGDSRIRFLSTLPENEAAPDIVYLNSSLQYIDDYAGQLRRLAALGSKRLLLGRTAVGDFPTFATRQLNLSGQVLGHWFINQNEIVEILRDQGYALVLKSLAGTVYDQGNFPVSHRIEQMTNMLFVRV